MLLKDLTKVYISKAEKTNNHGEYSKTWKFVKTAFFNIQQDINELDIKSTGEVNYDIIKCRTDKQYSIENGFGISFTDISKLGNFKPEYRILDQNKIGNTTTYRLEKYYGD